jgi:tetratricopeptide (TPR) repeat protein
MDVGDYTRARTLLDASLAIKRTLRDVAGIATSLHNLGDAALHMQDYASASALLEESLALFRGLAATDRVAQTLHSLGTVALRRGDLVAAEAQLREALSLFHAAGDGWGRAVCLEGLAELAAVSGSPAQAARQFGAADGWRAANGAPLPPNDRAEFDRAVALARAALGPASFAAEWSAGQALGQEQAVAEALAL